MIYAGESGGFDGAGAAGDVVNAAGEAGDVFSHTVSPTPAGGAHDAPPDPLVGWGEGNPLPIPHPTRRLRRLDLGVPNFISRKLATLAIPLTNLLPVGYYITSINSSLTKEFPVLPFIGSNLKNEYLLSL